MDNANVVMIRIMLMFSVFNFLADISAATQKSELTELQKFLIKLEQKYKDRGLDAITEDLKRLWADVLKGEKKYSPIEKNDAQKFLKKVAQDYNLALMEGVYRDLEDAWIHYMKAFGKQYGPEEKKTRKAAFKKSKEHMEKQNELYKQGKVSYMHKLNHLSDKAKEELEKLNGFRPRNITHCVHKERVLHEKDPCRYLYDRRLKVPDFVDWRKRGYVTSIKIQGHCSNCYAFAGLGALEAYHKKKAGNLISLSVQNILDCTWNLGNNGCNGGYIDLVFEYAKTKGIVPEEQYPYTMNASRKCKWKKEHVIALAKGFLMVPSGNEAALKQVVAKYGPVAAGVGMTEGFENYGSGVFHPPTCGAAAHSVLIVGYGTDPVDGDYWIIKNSFGDTWGTNGYMLLARNRNNVCGIASNAVFPK